MTSALPRLSMINLIRTTFRIYRQRAKFFIGISIIGPLLAAVYPLLFWLYRTDGGTRQQPILSWLPTVVGMLVATMFMLVGSMLSSAMVVRSVADLRNFAQASPSQQRHQTCIWSVVGIVFSVLMRMLFTGVSLAIVGAGLLAAAAALGFNSPAVAGAIGFAVAGGWLLGIILSSILIYAHNAVAIQSCILERVGRRAAMKRSALLTMGDRDRISALYSASMVLSCAIVQGQFMLLPRTYGIATWIVEAVAALLAGALTAPFWTIGIALIYCDECEQARATAVTLDQSQARPNRRYQTRFLYELPVRTKPLTRRTLSRLLMRRVVAGLADKVRVIGGTYDPTTPDDARRTRAPQLRQRHDSQLSPRS